MFLILGSKFGRELFDVQKQRIKYDHVISGVPCESQFRNEIIIFECPQ